MLLLLFLGRFWFCLAYLIPPGLVRASKLLHRILKFIMQIYSKSTKKCNFSISQRILILFVLSDRAWWGLRKFYTELWNSLILQIYAHLFKINENCHLSSIQKSQQICTSRGDVYYAPRNLLSTCYYYCVANSLYDVRILVWCMNETTHNTWWYWE